MKDQPQQAIIGLGANLGLRRQTIREALRLLQEMPEVSWVVASPVFETAPVGVVDQPAFLNLVAALETSLSPESLMERMLEIEQALGRRRDVRWGPRTIDLDLLFFGSETRNQPGLTLPHPRWSERSFVTIPLKALLAHPRLQDSRWDSLRKQLCDVSPDPNVRISEA
jgi:2-amino-4-hydroxy-6-hydroxymethyldihydropteridine diphosphokinase